MNSIDQHRKELDSIDDQLLSALAERLQIARTVATQKEDKGVRLRDRTREAALLARVAVRAESVGLPADAVVRVFQEILNLSFHEQIAAIAGAHPRTANVRVGFQGVTGAYSEWAAQRMMSARRQSANALGFRTFRAVAEAVVDGRVDYGILPAENTIAGSINDSYDLLKRHSLHIVGEEVLHIAHCLAAMPGVELHQLRRVYSHPQALAQCSAFLNDLPGVEVHAFFDTAAAMQKVATEEDTTVAAVGGEHAADRYGLRVLKKGIADHPENYTRFLLVAARPEPAPAGAASKTSLVMSVRHEEGALLQALGVIHAYHINLTKLESRPRTGHPWEYFFYVDFEGNESDPNVAAMLDELRGLTADLRVMGSYVSRTVSEGRPVNNDEIGRARQGDE